MLLCYVFIEKAYSRLFTVPTVAKQRPSGVWHFINATNVISFVSIHMFVTYVKTDFYVYVYVKLVKNHSLLWNAPSVFQLYRMLFALVWTVIQDIFYQ